MPKLTRMMVSRESGEILSARKDKEAGESKEGGRIAM